jgi:hypothetical protein
MDGPRFGGLNAQGARRDNRLSSAAGELTSLLTASVPSDRRATAPRAPQRWIVFRISIRKEQRNRPSDGGDAARLGGRGMGYRRQCRCGVRVRVICALSVSWRGWWMVGGLERTVTNTAAGTERKGQDKEQRERRGGAKVRNRRNLHATQERGERKGGNCVGGCISIALSCACPPVCVCSLVQKTFSRRAVLARSAQLRLALLCSALLLSSAGLLAG